MRLHKTILSASVALAVFAGVSARADNMASIAITPATGTVALTPRWSIGGNLAGFHHMAQDLSLGGGANQFYSIKSTPIPSGGDIAAFTLYIAGSGAATNHADIGSKLTPNSYSALTSADPDLGYGPVQMYFIHHKVDGDYFTHLVPSSGTASAVADLKPMSQPGGPATGGLSGYFGLTFAAVDLGYGANLFYYLRTDAVTGFTQFGSLVPALAGASSDRFNLGTSGHNALAFTGTDVGYSINQMYYLRLDTITGFTVLGTLNPATGKVADIANLGSVFSTLTFVPGDVGFGTGQFYTTGPITPNWQSVSFAAIADRTIVAGSFTVAPTASSNLPVTLHVVAGSVGNASISAPVAGVFTVTPTAPGLITLQATQAGASAPTAFEYNMLRQSFTASGTATLQITSQPTPQSVVMGSTATFSVTASGTTSLSYQWRKDGANINGNASATTSTLTLTNAQAANVGSYDVVVTNLSGSIISNAVLLAVTAPAAPVITNSPLSAGATVGTPFSFTITASGSPTTFSATPLPAGLTLAASTGAITGTPTTAGTTNVLLGATNAGGTGNATLTITVAAAGVAPNITNNPLTAGGTVGTAFSFTITATGSPTSYAASPLPAGLAINTTSGAITGTPTSAGTTNVLLGATNSTGTDNATLTITVAAAGIAPVITNSPLTAAGTVGTAFSFTITATGSPTSYAGSPLPAGLSIVAATGAITGTPTTAGTTNVLLGATNGTGTGNATLTITVSAAGVAPVITNSPLTAGGTVGTAFSFGITATGSPTSYSASPLPAGLSRNATTGVIAGTPTTAGTTNVALGATNSTGTGNATLTITVAAAGVAPTITNNPLTAGATVGTAFSFGITASGSPTSYTATPLPAGLSVVAATGAITGTPTTAGTTNVVLGATNGTGTGNATLTITVVAAGVAPSITNSSNSLTGGTATVGSLYSFTITAAGSPTSYTATPLPAGLSIVAATGVITGTPTTAGTTNVVLGATNGTGTGNATLTIVVSAAPTAPTITPPSSTPTGTTGTPFTYPVVASGSPTSYSATGLPPGLTINTQTGVISGTPTTSGTWTVTVTATNSVGTSSTTLTITVNAAPYSRIVAFSARATSGPGEQTLIVGFVTTGNNKHLLVRGIGPSLATQGVATALADPLLTLFGTNGPVAMNDDWYTPMSGQPAGSPAAATGAQIASTALQVGAFTLANTSKDSALLFSVNAGAHTTALLRPNSTAGTALIELYDVDTTSESRMVGVAARMNVTAGEGTLIAGIVVAGNTSKRLLIRGVGPALASYGVSGVLADPKLTVFSGTTQIATNDNWEVGTSTAAEIMATAASVGEFPLPSGSKDAALIITLQPGVYTVHVTSTTTATGVALVEVYDTQ